MPSNYGKPTRKMKPREVKDNMGHDVSAKELKKVADIGTYRRHLLP